MTFSRRDFLKTGLTLGAAGAGGLLGGGLLTGCGPADGRATRRHASALAPDDAGSTNLARFVALISPPEMLLRRCYLPNRTLTDPEQVGCQNAISGA